MRLTIAVLMTMASFTLHAGECVSEDSKKEVIESHLNSDGRTTVLIYPRDPGVFEIRYYPGDLNCIVTLEVSDTCEISDFGTEVFGAGGLEVRPGFCWDPSEEED